MKGEAGSNMIVIVVLALLAAAVAIGFFSSQTVDADETFNNTSETTSGQISNASCKRDCRTKYPSEGAGYYTCLQNNGCA